METGQRADRRLIIVVLDGAGIGAMPDAAEYGDAGSNTIVHVATAVGGLDLPNLRDLGLGNLASIEGVPAKPACAGCYGTMLERSKGKDTITGHWEMAGIITRHSFPTYPQGFPPDVIDAFEKSIGRKVLGNYPASGTEIIKQLGEEHMRTGFPIVYTSADSVFQIAAHEDIIPVSELYDMCEKARKIMAGEHNVARIIARPFIGLPGNFQRTENRRDFSICPPHPTVLDALCLARYEVAGVGKIGDIFSGQGISKSYHAGDNQASIDCTIQYLKDTGPGLIFANLVDFDMLYGHRNDPRGFAHGLKEFDDRLPDVQAAMQPDDLLIVTADHGVDPTTTSTDHSREKVLLLVWGESAAHGVNLGERESFVDIAATITDLFHLHPWPVGKSFADLLLRES